MEMIDVMYELTSTKTALEAAGKTIRKLKGKCVRKNLLMAGLVWFGLTACKMLGESDKKCKELEDKNRQLEAAYATCAAATYNNEKPDMDICCDGKASIDKKEV